MHTTRTYLARHDRNEGAAAGTCRRDISSAAHLRAGRSSARPLPRAPRAHCRTPRTPIAAHPSPHARRTLIAARAIAVAALRALELEGIELQRQRLDCLAERAKHCGSAKDESQVRAPPP
ncbi:MAG TPA: hypothetical protein VG963_26610, partial [Polyangiaceae bacterium]|nr:hypothetical protein [Polyangiaceae bacterium]